MEKNGTLPGYRSELPVAVDAMGSDRGSAAIVEGAVEAFREYGVRSVLVGPEEKLRKELERLGASNHPVSVAHASEVIEMEESPARAVRRKPDSSICVAYRLLSKGQASSVLSAGNSGAMMAAGRLTCGLMPGIERPAIATLFPVAGDGLPNVILDSGANVDCHAQNLVQFAVMGTIYYQSLFDGRKPRVALLSNGSELSKGTDVIRAASILLSQMESIDFIGYVEGRDVATHAADVIVCDGFVGNVLLKAMEGCVQLISKQLIHEYNKGFFRKFGFLSSRSVFHEVFRMKFDHTAYGGAPLLGLTKLALVLHGSSGPRSVKNAIRIADTFAESGMTDQISAALAQLEETFPDEDDAILLAGFRKEGSNAPMKLKKKGESSEEDDLAELDEVEGVELDDND